MALTWNEECRQAARFSDAKSKFIHTAVAAVAPEAERLHGQWCGPNWREAEAADAVARAEWESKHGWGWYLGWDKKVTKGGRNAARFQIKAA